MSRHPRQLVRRPAVLALSIGALAVGYLATDGPSPVMPGCPEDPPQLADGTAVGPCGDHLGEVERRQVWFERYTHCLARYGTYPC
jgi:hypothetical protein